MKNYDPFNWFWIIGGDETQGYSSAAAAMVPLDQVDQERLTRIDSMENLIDVLRKANVPPYHRVSVYRIVRRLEEAGLSAQALAVLDDPQNAVLRARFYSLAGPVESGTGIPANDPDAITLVLAAGGDPAAILAPE